MSRTLVEQQTLRRDVGWYGAFSMGYADVGADIYVAIGLVTLFAGGAAPLAFLIASITYVTTAMAYSELATMYPYAGGAQVYAMKAFNDLAGFVAGWAVMLDYVVDMALFSLASAGYLSYFFPAIMKETIPILGVPVSALGLSAALLIGILLVLNLTGIRGSSIFNEVMVSFSLLIEGIILVAGFVLAFNLPRFLSQVAVLGSPSRFFNILYPVSNMSIQAQNFIYATTIAMTSFIGIESIAQAAEETKRPYKWIPRANKLSIVSVVIFAVGLSTVSMGMMSWQELASAAADPIRALASHIPVLGPYLGPVVAVTGFLICYVSTNTGVIGVSRIVFSMGRFALLPRWFYRVHPKFRTPTRTIIIFGVIGIALALVGELTFVADLYNFGALLSYILVNSCVIVLRNKDRTAFRAWKAPGTITLRFHDREIFIPSVSVVGAVSCSILFLLILSFHHEGRILGASWMLIGMMGYILLRKMRRMSILTSDYAKSISPGGYMMNASVLVRMPDDEEAVVAAIREAFDTRFRLRLVNIIDPVELGLSTERVTEYREIREYSSRSLTELESIARRLKSVGYDVDSRVEIGSLPLVVDNEAQSDSNDVVGVIKRKTLRSHVQREQEDSVMAILSKYPGKLVVIRRA